MAGAVVVAAGIGIPATQASAAPRPLIISVLRESTIFANSGTWCGVPDEVQTKLLGPGPQSILFAPVNCGAGVLIQGVTIDVACSPTAAACTRVGAQIHTVMVVPGDLGVWSQNAVFWREENHVSIGWRNLAVSGLVFINAA